MPNIPFMGDELMLVRTALLGSVAVAKALRALHDIPPGTFCDKPTQHL
jgi:hypothetical protein